MQPEHSEDHEPEIGQNTPEEFGWFDCVPSVSLRQELEIAV